MPFAVFRQHQRKLLAVFAIMAMVGFVLSDTLPRWINSGGVNNEDYVVADLFDRSIRRSDIATMGLQRERANQFMSSIGGEPNFFGGTSQAEMIDAMILKHEADRLEIPATSAYARRWIDQQTRGGMTAPMFEMILSRFNSTISGEELLINLAEQIRIAKVREEVAMPVVTPLDVFRNYRDQTERTSFKTIPFVVDSFVTKVGEPTDADLEKLYAAGKDLLPNPDRVAPGFKIPRKIQVEYVSINAAEIARQIREQLPEAEVAAYYETKKKDFPLDLGLPPDLFLGEPNLTPPRYLPFAEQKDVMTAALAREKADEQVIDTLGNVRDEVVDPYTDAYLDAEAEVAEAKKEGRSTDGIQYPKFQDMTAVAAKYHLKHETSPLLDQEEAENYERISRATTGSSQSGTGTDFDHTLFDSTTSLYEGLELTDPIGDHFLVRKLKDEPAHIAPLAEVREQVVRAWKVAQARPLARKAAEDYAKQLRTEGGTIKNLTVDNRPVIAINDVTKLKPGIPIPSQFAGQFRMERGPATPADFIQIPQAGEPLIDAMFGLKPGDVAVEPDEPETTYYVLTLDRRSPVSYQSLMGPMGAFTDYGGETRLATMRKSYADGMTRLRELANYKETKVGDLIAENNPTAAD